MTKKKRTEDIGDKGTVPPNFPLIIAKGDLEPDGTLTKEKFEQATIRQGKKMGFSNVSGFSYDDIGVFFSGEKEGTDMVSLFLNPNVKLDKERGIMLVRVKPF